MSQEEVDEALAKGPDTVILSAGDYTKYEGLDFQDINVQIDGEVIIDDLDLDGCTLSAVSAGAYLNVTGTLTLKDTTTDKTNLTISAANEVVKDSSADTNTSTNTKTIYFTPEMSADEINKEIESNPDIIVFKEGDYTHIDSITLDDSIIEIDGDVTIDSMTLNNCSLKGTSAGCTLTVLGGLTLNDTQVNSETLTIDQKETSGTWIHLENGSWMYKFDNGTYAAGGLFDIDGQTYCFDNSSILFKGWVKEGDVWYYFGSSGAAKTGWLYQDGQWYYMNSQGQMQTGWLTLGDSRYYLAPRTGIMLQDRWGYIDGAWHYFYDSGAMAVNTVINGYEINAEGIWA